jgi:cyclic dehypoxanthinyl futalosine synthase
VKKTRNHTILLKKAINGERLNTQEGVKILEEADLLALGQTANLVRQRLHPQKTVTFTIDRNINYTNVCWCQCRFCAFWRELNDKDAYVIDKKELVQKIKETIVAGGTSLLLQGGLHPHLGLDYYLDLLKFIKENFNIHLHSFSPPEIIHLARKEGLSVQKVLVALRKAGLDTLPGGGAEILVDRVRKQISPRKITAGEWLETMRQAHALGMKTTATMMFGHVETLAERVLHLMKIRELQDETGGFTAFIPWTYQSPAGRNQQAPVAKMGTSVDYLRTLALARLMLDNIPHLQVSWVTQGIKVAQVALFFGADDFGSTMLEENVVRAAGATVSRISPAEIIHFIQKAGFKPAQRTVTYEIIKIF